MNNSISKADELISKIFSEIGNSSQEANRTFSIWKEVLMTIKNSKIDGSQLADHSRIIDLKNNILIIETDHPGRIQLFQMYKNYIQNGINKNLPDLQIKNIVFKLKKTDKVEIKKDVNDIIREKLLADNIDDDFEIKYPTNNASLTIIDFENGFGKIVKYGIDDYLSNPTADFSEKDFRKK